MARGIKDSPSLDGPNQPLTKYDTGEVKVAKYKHDGLVPVENSEDEKNDGLWVIPDPRPVGEADSSQPPDGPPLVWER